MKKNIALLKKIKLNTKFLAFSIFDSLLVLEKKLKLRKLNFLHTVEDTKNLYTKTDKFVMKA